MACFDALGRRADDGDEVVVGATSFVTRPDVRFCGCDRFNRREKRNGSHIETILFHGGCGWERRIVRGCRIGFHGQRRTAEISSG